MGPEYTPPMDKCLHGAKLAVENAESLLESAEQIAEIENYGHATSLLVLAGEEAFKALAFMCRHDGLEITSRLEDWRMDMMQDHQTRHQYAAGSAVMLRIIAIIMKSAEAFQERREEGIEAAREARMEVVKEESARLLDPESSASKKLDSEIDWWKQANDLKEEGFYVDYGPGEWESPDQLDEEDYERAKEIVVNWVELLGGVVEGRENASQDTVEAVSDAQKEMIKELSDEFE